MVYFYIDIDFDIWQWFWYSSHLIVLLIFDSDCDIYHIWYYFWYLAVILIFIIFDIIADIWQWFLHLHWRFYNSPSITATVCTVNWWHLKSWEIKVRKCFDQAKYYVIKVLRFYFLFFAIFMLYTLSLKEERGDVGRLWNYQYSQRYWHLLDIQIEEKLDDGDGDAGRLAWGHQHHLKCLHVIGVNWIIGFWNYPLSQIYHIMPTNLHRHQGGRSKLASHPVPNWIGFPNESGCQDMVLKSQAEWKLASSLYSGGKPPLRSIFNIFSGAGIGVGSLLPGFLPWFSTGFHSPVSSHPVLLQLAFFSR